MLDKAYAGKVRMSRGDRVFNMVIMLILAFVVLVTIYPIYFVVIASFSDSTALANGQVWLYPKQIYLEGYRRIFAYSDLWRGYLNTMIYTVSDTLLSLAVTIPGAYVMSRKECMLNRSLMIFFTIPMFFPADWCLPIC